MRFKRVIIWGHPLHSHTHSYIHYGFFRAFCHLGYETLWLDNDSDVSGLDMANTLFLTESQVDAGIPLRKDCTYILHNVDGHRYPGRKMNIQVYTKEVPGRSVQRLDDGVYMENDGKLMYFPWGTSLLPHEFQETLKAPVASQTVNWVGTVGEGLFGNLSELAPFRDSCTQKRIKFATHGHVSEEDKIRLIRESLIAPAIVGRWQKEQGYVPCRTFKNISYGHFGITNSVHVQELFGGRLICESDPTKLFDTSVENVEKQDNKDLQEYVRAKHTYLNRIKHILEAL